MRTKTSVIYSSIKTYGHSKGWSSAFRQPGAESHCHDIHGYALGMQLHWQAYALDSNNWVVDFGALKLLEKRLADQFDHRLLVAKDDPVIDLIQRLDRERVASVRVMDHVGCEAFAEWVFCTAEQHLIDTGLTPRVWLRSAMVSEHDGNAAMVERQHTPTRSETGV